MVKTKFYKKDKIIGSDCPYCGGFFPLNDSSHNCGEVLKLSDESVEYAWTKLYGKPEKLSLKDFLNIVEQKQW